MSRLTRRQFAAGAAAASATALVPRWVLPQTQTAPAAAGVVVRADAEIGVVRPELHSHFVEHLGSCVYGGLWVGKDSRIPNINGYRRQAIEYLRELGVPVLRWPGGCFADDYHWRDGIGPLERRPKRVNIHWGGYVEDGSFGTHEFIGLCRLLGAEPYLAGNVGSGTPQELRDWVEYCNFPSGSALAGERAANGSPEPFRVRYWGVGNENWGCGGEMTPEDYADLYRRFAVYLREYGGTKLYLIACGPNGNDVRWSQGVLDGLRRRLPHGFAMHFYSGGREAPTRFTPEAMNEQLASFARVEQAVIQQRSILDGYTNGRNVGLLLDEWGVWDRIPAEDQQRNGRLWQQITMRSAVAAALGLNLFNRQADKLAMTNIAQMVNVLHALVLTDGPGGEGCVRTTTYYAYLLFKPHRAKTAVRVETEDTSPLALSVSASKGDGELVLSFVNPRHDRDIEVDCELRGVSPTQASAQILQDSDLNAFNAFDNPARVVPRALAVRLDGSRLRFDLLRLGVATARLRLT